MAVTPHSLGIVRSGDRQPIPWKNGQGATREIARRLLGIKGPHFVWRLSVSDIAKDADFGAFPGVQRSATLVYGDGVTIDVAGTPHALGPHETVTFDGSLEAHARLTDGPVSILNVFTVANRMDAAVRVADLSDGRPLSIAGATVLVLLDGSASVYAADGASGNLAPLDALVPRPRVRLVSGSGTAAVVRMENYRAWRAFSW
jgi:environmental stress-induced protein Ves